MFFPVGHTFNTKTLAIQDKDKGGYVNQYGLSRKVRFLKFLIWLERI